MRVLIVLAALVVAGFIATSAQAGEKVTICHATGSEGTPYVGINTARAAWDNGHHSQHDGDYLVVPGQPCPPEPVMIDDMLPDNHGPHHDSPEPVGSSISQAPEPSVPVAFPSSGG